MAAVSFGAVIGDVVSLVMGPVHHLDTWGSFVILGAAAGWILTAVGWAYTAHKRRAAR